MKFLFWKEEFKIPDFFHINGCLCNLRCKCHNVIMRIHEQVDYKNWIIFLLIRQSNFSYIRGKMVFVVSIYQCNITDSPCISH